MALIRPKDEPRVTSPTAGDALLLDGLTTRSIAYENLIRDPLAAVTQFYVNPATGSDTLNNGRTALTPFATRQKAISTVRNSLDQRGYSAPINLADGSYTDAVSIDGGGPYIMTGNVAAPQNIVDAVVGACNITVKNAYLTVSGFEMRNLVGSLFELGALDGGDITFSAMRFGTTDGDQLFASGGKIHGSGPYSIVGNVGSHGHSRFRGMIDIANSVVTLPAGITIGNYFFGINDASVHFINSSFAGAGAGVASTGVRALIHNNASFISNGAISFTGLPGNSAVQLYSTGQYDDIVVGDNQPGTPYVPTIVSHTVGGTPATYTLNAAKYKMLQGKFCYVSGYLTVTNQGVGNSGTVDVALPFPALAGSPANGSSIELSTTFAQGGAYVGAGASVMRLADQNGASYITTGRIVVFNVLYEIA